MYKWSWVIFEKKSKFHDAGGPDTVVSPTADKHNTEAFCDFQYRSDKTRLFANFGILIQEKV